MNFSTRPACAAAAAILVVGCGGGSSDSGESAAPVPAPAVVVTDAQRIAAAIATAQTNSECTAVRPFYWEIGDKTSALASGSLAAPSSLTYARSTAVSIASASKWLYGAYVVQRRNGALTADDIKHLHFQSGYTSFEGCDQDASVAECQAAGTNGAYTAANDGQFFYGGGHMEKHATTLGLGPLRNAELAAEIKSQVGDDVDFFYLQPQLAGGIFASAEGYSVFLRKILSGALLMRSALGTSAVCTNPSTCATAVKTPSPRGESWRYSIGHWVEDDPVVGDGAFSSPGAFGFYPWIDASKTYYGIVSRFDPTGAIDSVYCGRLIRKAWLSGGEQ